MHRWPCDPHHSFWIVTHNQFPGFCTVLPTTCIILTLKGEEEEQEPERFSHLGKPLSSAQEDDHASLSDLSMLTSQYHRNCLWLCSSLGLKALCLMSS